VNQKRLRTAEFKPSELIVETKGNDMRNEDTGETRRAQQSFWVYRAGEHTDGAKVYKMQWS